MKKSLITLFVLLFCISSSFSQTTDRKEFEKVVIAINSQLPMSLGPSMTLESMSMNNKEVLLKYQINDIGNTMSNMSLSDEKIKKNAMKMMSASDDTKKLYLSIAELGLNCHLSYVSENTGIAKDVILSPEELKAGVELCVPSDDRVNMIIEATNCQLPIKLANGMTITCMKVQDGFLTTVVELDENQYDLSHFQNGSALEYIEEYANTDLTTQMQWKIFAEAGLGIRYTWVGNITKKPINVDIPNHRLTELLKNED